MMKKEYDKAIVSCRRIVCNPCALDEYEVTITPHGASELIEYTYGGPFESDEAICGRVYRQWLKENKF